MSEVPIFFKGEARLIRWSESANAGRTVTLEIEEVGDRHPFKGLRYGASNGQRMAVVFVLIGDDETPVTQAEGPGQVPKSEPIPIHKGKKFSEQKRSQQAYNKIRDKNFQDWLLAQPTTPKDDIRITARSGDGYIEFMDAILKTLLGIESKSELDTDFAKGKLWDGMLTDFDTRGYRR